MKKKILLLLSVLIILGSLGTAVFADPIYPEPIRESVINVKGVIYPEPIRETEVHINEVIYPEPIRE